MALMRTLDSVFLYEIVRRIVVALEPTRIYLYGSHAYGQPHADSDVDIFVLIAHSALPPHKRALEAYRMLCGVRAPIEITVSTTEGFERRRQWISSLERVINEKGRILYESSTEWLEKAS